MKQRTCYRGTRPSALSTLLLAVFCLFGSPTVVQGAIVASGNVEPAIASWDSSTYGYVGRTSDGRVMVDAGSQLASQSGYIGCAAGVTGEASLTGPGSTWTSTHDLHVGSSGSGTLRIDAGAQVSDYAAFLGYYSGSTGAATVTGSGSKWTSLTLIGVGRDGSGTLTVADGGEVTAHSLSVSNSPQSNGTITVADGGTVIAGELYASLSSLHGNGMITVTEGAVLDADLRFDAAHGTQQTLPFGTGGRLTVSVAGGNLGVGYKESGTLIVAEGVTVASSSGYLGFDSGSTGTATFTGPGSKWNNGYKLHVGSSGSGTLRIEGGGQVSSSYATLAGDAGSTATATVKGPGSKWNNTYDLYVGWCGNATLRIEAGAEVSNTVAYLGLESGSSTATVTGPGSKWSNSGALYVGRDGNGTLNITSGGAVTASTVSISSGSLLAIDVGDGSLLAIGGGSGTISNGGKVRVMAGAGPAATSQFSPIAAGTWSGSGTYQALGGTWNSTSHVFAVSAVERGTSGTPVAMDLASVQRVLIDDSETDWSLGASFLAKTGSSTQLNLTATAIAGQVLSDLMALLDPSQVVCGAWDVTPGGSGYTPGDPIYLSFDVGAGFSRSDLHLWHYDGSNWSSLEASDLTYNGKYAGFTVTSLSGYAVSAVPEPGSLTLLAILGAISLLAYAWRRRKRAVQCATVGTLLALAGGVAQADVFNMDPGLTSLEFVTVGNPGNANDTR